MLAFEQSTIQILNDPVLLGELQAFQAEQLPGGMLRYSAPGGGYDDCVMSLSLAWTVVARQSRYSYGLIEFWKAEQRATDAGQPSLLDAKPTPAAEESTVCCGMQALKLPGTSGWRCPQCGRQWGARVKVSYGPSRAEMLSRT